MSNGKFRSALVIGCAMLAFGACTVNVAPPSVTSLTISNGSSYGLEFVEWSGVGFNNPASVYEPILGYNVEGIAAGYSVGRTVNPDRAYIFFQDPGNPTDWRTLDAVSVGSGESASFTFLDGTGGTARVLMSLSSTDGSVRSRSLALVPWSREASRVKASSAAAAKALK